MADLLDAGRAGDGVSLIAFGLGLASLLPAFPVVTEALVADAVFSMCLTL